MVSSGGDEPAEEHLAPVRYLFGASPPERASEQPPVPPAALGPASSESAPAVRPPVAPMRGGTRSDAWYVEEFDGAPADEASPDYASADDASADDASADDTPVSRAPGADELASVQAPAVAPRALRAVPALATEAEGAGTADGDGDGASVVSDAHRFGGPTTEGIAAATAAARVFFTEADQDAADHNAAEPEEQAAAGKKKPPVVRTASINALARKGMSSAEMVKLLEAREIDPDEAAAEVERLEGVGLLDDKVLAEHLVRTLQERKGLGRSAINAELRRRQVDQAAIDEALEAVDVDDELERCMEIANKRASQLRSYDRTTAERRLSAFLMRRGYSGSVVSAAVSAALGPAGPRFR